MGRLILPAIPEMSRSGMTGLSRDSRETFRSRELREPGANGTPNLERKSK
jgi:hypothetical protein